MHATDTVTATTSENELKRIRELLTDKFLAQRPSLRRVQARLRKHEMTISRTDYQVLMREIYTLQALFKFTEVKVPEDAEVVRYKVNYWGNSTNPNFQVKAELRPKKASLIAELKAQAVKIPKPRASHYALKGGARPEVVGFPDMHVGFKRLPDGTLEPIHDENCLALSIEVLRYLQPPTLILFGDNLDFASFSSFTKKNELWFLANEAVQRLYVYLAQVRAVCPNTRIIYIEGNHEARLARYIAESCPELMGLCRGGESVEVFSIRHLLNLDQLNIEYVGDYGTHTWVDAVRYLHGELLGKNGGETVAKMLNEYVESSACGHNHRLELAFKTRMTLGSLITTWAASCGTFGRIDGTIPGRRYPDAQQGFLIAWDSRNPQLIPIYEGGCRIGPMRFEVELG